MTFIGSDEGRVVGAVTLKTLREAPTSETWYTYQNHDLGSYEVGMVRFLLVGPHSTFHEPPKRYPDTHLGLGWRYLLVGQVDLDAGRIVDLPKEC